MVLYLDKGVGIVPRMVKAGSLARPLKLGGSSRWPRSEILAVLGHPATLAHDEPSQQEHQRRLRSAEDLVVSPALEYVARLVSYALALTSREGLAAYGTLSRIFRACLTSSECQGVAYAALKACDPKAARGIYKDLFEPDAPAGPPDPFDCTDPVEDAEWWADTASQIELRAYGMSCMARIPEAERPVMLAALKGRAAA